MQAVLLKLLPSEPRKKPSKSLEWFFLYSMIVIFNFKVPGCSEHAWLQSSIVKVGSIISATMSSGLPSMKYPSKAQSANVVSHLTSQWKGGGHFDFKSYVFEWLVWLACDASDQQSSSCRTNTEDCSLSQLEGHFQLKCTSIRNCCSLVITKNIILRDQEYSTVVCILGFCLIGDAIWVAGAPYSANTWLSHSYKRIVPMLCYE